MFQGKQTKLLQLNGRRSIWPLFGTNKHGLAAFRSSYVRERDNILIDNNGNEQQEMEDDSKYPTDDAPKFEPVQKAAQEPATAPTNGRQ